MNAHVVDPKTVSCPVVDVLIEEQHGWRKRDVPSGILWSKGVLYNDTWSHVAQRLADGLDAAADVVASADGHFAFVYIGTDWCLAATDRIGSIPISFAAVQGGWVVGSEARRVATAAGCDNINEDAVMALAMAGYTIGAATYYKELSALDPGEWVAFLRNAPPQRQRYYVYAPQPEATGDASTLLTKVLAGVFEKTVASLDGRTVMIPLSAGLDSRLVASGLREMGYAHVRCFSYGQPGNHEAVAARRISEKLDYPWTFLPYTPRQQASTFRSDECNAFVAFADTLQAIPFQQDFYAVGELKRSGFAPPDAVFINGQSGDFITGNHIPKALGKLHKDEDQEVQWRRFLEVVIEKHFDLWSVLKTPDRITRIGALLRQDLIASGVGPDSTLPAFSAFEAIEYKNRQSKYVVAGQRAYEWYGFDWRLPLWDSTFVDFWSRASLSDKVGQRLFSETLRRLDWGGVWGDAYWPRPNITPAWIVLPRLLSKICHAPLGRDSWHRFERQFLAWRMDTVCNYAIAPYLRVATDRRGHRNAISWHVERYLGDKGLDLGGRSLGAA